MFLYQQDMPYREVAVKVLRHQDIDERTLAMFTAEADVMAQLSSHPNIVTIHQASVSADGRPYLVMEVCVDSYGSRYRAGTMPVPEVLDVGVRIGSALATCHANGMLHRDLKPANILISSYGQPLLSDFGVAGAIAAMDSAEGVAMSLPWSAPEVVSASSSGSVAADVWGLGATLYGMLAGRSPFEDSDPRQNAAGPHRERIMRAQYQPIGRQDLPPGLENVLRRALAKDPTGRYQTVGEMVGELQQIQASIGLAASAAPQSAIVGGQMVRPESFAPAGLQRSTVPVESSRLRRPAREERSRLVQRQSGSQQRRWLIPVAVVLSALVTASIVIGVLLLTGGLS